MRQGLLAFAVVTLTPFAAQAGEAFAVPPSGVLISPQTVASLYDSDTMTNGKPVAASSPAAIRRSTTPNAAKPAPRHTASVPRSSLAPYVRHTRRPPATLPPGVIAPPPYRPGMVYQPPALPPEPVQATAYTPPAPASTSAPAARGFAATPAPNAPASSGTTFSNLFSPERRTMVGRGLFTGSTAASAQPVNAPQPIYVPRPAVPQGQPIY